MAKAPDTITLVIDRRTAENFYYALALALGGAAPFDGGGKKNGGKGKGKASGKTPTKVEIEAKVLKGLI